MHFRPKAAIMIGIIISIPAMKVYSSGYMTTSSLLTTILISLVVSFGGVTAISYILAIFSMQAVIRAHQGDIPHAGDTSPQVLTRELNSTIDEGSEN